MSRRVLVTGATSGLGRATARAFAAAGDRVVATGRRTAALAALAADGAAVETHAGDLTDAAFVDRLVAACGALDIFVHCAGMLRHAPFLETTPEYWREALDTNVLALLRLAQPIARAMTARKTGHIIVVSSILARQVYPYTLVYAATKHATAAICKGLRLELRDQGVKVTEIAPGLADTAILAQVTHPEVRAAYAARTYPPMRAEDVAAAILYAAGTDFNACPELVALNPLGQS